MLSLQRPHLQKNAVPKIFPNLPKYLSKPTPKARTDPQLRKNDFITRQENAIETFMSSDIIVDFDDLINNYSVTLHWIHSVSKKLSCRECISLIRAEKGTKINNEYFDNLQREGLSIATESVNFIFVHMCSILEYILNDHLVLSKFLQSQNQKTILCELTLRSIELDFYYSEFTETCSCGLNSKFLLNSLCSVFANILLNNYVKNRNNDVNVAKRKHLQDSRKLPVVKNRKLSTLM